MTDVTILGRLIGTADQVDTAGEDLGDMQFEEVVLNETGMKFLRVSEPGVPCLFWSPLNGTVTRIDFSGDHHEFDSVDWQFLVSLPKFETC